MHFDGEKDCILKIDAYISHLLHIPFPEKLDDTLWAEKWAQAQFLIEKGVLGEVTKNDTDRAGQAVRSGLRAARQ